MPFTSSQKSQQHALETKVAGLAIDALGRKWDPSKHPRDSRGRFIETGGIARVGLGGLGKVLRSMIGGKVEVQMRDGSRRVVPHQHLTMVRRPNGAKPTASVRKVVEEDAAREQHPQRGDGKFETDENPDIEVPDEDPSDEDDENPYDGDDNDPQIPDVPEAYTPSRDDARSGDLVAVTAVTKDGKSHTLFGKVDHLDQSDTTKPDNLTLAGGKQVRLRELMAIGEADGATADYTIIPFEDLNDPAAFMSDAEDDNGKASVLDNETATDLVEGHAKSTAPKPTEKRPQTAGGGKRHAPPPGEPVTKDDIVMGRKPGTVEVGGRIVGRIEKDPQDPTRWKVTDRYGRSKTVGQKWDTGRTQLAHMLNTPPEPKGQKTPAAPRPAAGNARDRAIARGETPEQIDGTAAALRAASDSELDRAAAETDYPTTADLAREEQQTRRGTRHEAAQPDTAPATPEAVERTTVAKASKQRKSLTRVETSVGAASKSPSGNIIARTSGRSNWHAYRKADHTPAPSSVQAGDYIAEMGPADENGKRSPVAYYQRFAKLPGGLNEFRDDYVGDPERDRTLTEASAAGEAAREQGNLDDAAHSDRMAAVAAVRTEEDLDTLESAVAALPEGRHRDSGMRAIGATRARMEQAAAPEPSTDKTPAPTPRLPEGAAPQKKPTVDATTKPDAASRLPEGAAPQKPKGDGRPTTVSDRDYADPTEGGTDGTLRSDGPQVLGDVPAVAGRNDERPDRVLHEPELAGGGADRGGAPDAPDTAPVGDAGAGRGRAPSAAVVGDGERDGGSRVPIAGAGDRGQEAAGVHAPGLGDGPAVARPARDKAGPNVAKNIEALRTLRAIEGEGRPATAAERKVLAGWSGWGALPKVFDESDSQYASERAALKELLSDDEWRKARTNMLNAHYTDPALVASIWDGLKNLGFKGGDVLEPGSGSGNFIAAAPAGTHMTGVEVEPVTAGIARALHPDAEIHLESFAKSPFRAGVFDAVIGNVPFGSFSLLDRKHNRENHSIHNHFIIKSLDALKPGGVMAVVTSSFTLDNQSDTARQAMYAQADLIGAVRLPENAHSKAAGTSVVTDVLLFRKRKDGEAPGDDSWLRTNEAHDKDGNVVTGIKRGEKDPTAQHINDYYGTHPDDLLGELRSGGYNGLKVVGSGDNAAKLRDRLVAIAAQARKSGLGFNADRGDEGTRVAKRDSGSTREGRISFKATEITGKGKPSAMFERIEDGQPTRFEVPSTQADEFRSLLELRDLYDALMEAETEAGSDDDDTMAAARAALRNAYRRHVAQHGPVSRYTVTEKEDGSIKTTFPPVMGKFRQDEGAAVVYGLEAAFDPDTQKAKESDVLHSRQLNVAREAAQHTDDPHDAIALAAERPGGLSNKTLAEVLQTTPGKARAMVRGLVFNDPGQSGQMVARAAYLSGNVRTKLAAARAASAEDAAYEENVKALEEVLPAAATLGDIPLQLGSAFITPEVVTQFARSLMGRQSDVTVERDETAWKVPTPKGRYGRNAQLENSTWGTDDRSFYQLLESILKGQHRIIRVTRRNEDGSSYVDRKASEEAAIKAQEIEQEFQDWVWANPDVGDALAATYTERHRSLVPRSYDDAPQRAYPGMTAHLTPRPHQNAAITRAVNEPAVMFEHVVGAGKTYTLAGAAMELRRLGLARKPVLAVPGHMLAQWTAEFRELYPNAKILAADSDVLAGKENRKRFAAIASNNDWDVVLMTHTAFESIPTSREWEEKYLYSEIDKYQRQLDRASQAKDKRTEKSIQTKIEKLKNKIEDRLSRRKDDDGITFEAMGFDYVMADEAHVYKNLDFQTSMQGITSPEGSGRARDMHMKLELLRSQKPTDGTERVAAFATGTPISNSLAEMYTMTRFMRPDLLEEAGVGDFDSWAATFATVSAKVEQDTSANGWVERVRMRGFTDALGDALRIWRTFSDTKTAKDLNLPRPTLKGGAREVHAVEPSEAQMEALVSFKDRVESLPPGRAKKGDDTHVAIIGDGRRAAIDPRLMSQRGLGWSGIDPQDENIDSPKIDAAAAKILGVWRARQGDTFKVDHKSDQDAELTGALQMVMIDSDAPKRGRRSSYQMLKDRLVAGGMPADQIRFVQEAAGSSEKKAKLFDDARQGRVAVLMGSTASLGTGTNVQNRLYALHHIDGSWKPSDIEQREGRILRQGNQYGEVEIHAYVTKRTHDVKTWDMTAYKQAALDAIAHGSYDMRAVEFADDVDPLTDYDTITGLASGDPLVQDRRDLAPELKRLRNAERSHRRQIDRAKGVVMQAERTIEVLGQRRERLEAALARRTDITGDSFRMSLNAPGGYRSTVHATRKDAAEALRAFAEHELDTAYMAPGRQPKAIIGSIGGLDIRMSTVNESGAKKQIALELTTGAHYADPLPLAAVTIGAEEARNNIEGALTRLENRVNGIENAIAKIDTDKRRQIEELGAAQEATTRRFRFAGDLADSERRELLLDKLLTGNVDDQAGESMGLLREEYAEVTERSKSAEQRAKTDRMNALKAEANRAPDPEPLKVTPIEQAAHDEQLAEDVAEASEKPAAPTAPSDEPDETPDADGNRMAVLPADLPQVEDAGEQIDVPDTVVDDETGLPINRVRSDEQVRADTEPRAASGGLDPDTDVIEAAEEARAGAEAEALDSGATPVEAEQAGERAADAVVADVATEDADHTGERPVVPDTSVDDAKGAGDTLTPRQLPDEKYPLNDQQQAIADQVVANRNNVLVRAKAGTGKTSTLEAIARRFESMDPKQKIIYICFNKTVQVEADGRMPQNVESRTGHSLSYQWAGKDFTDAKMGGFSKKPTNTVLYTDQQVADHLGITADMPTNEQGSSLTPRRQAALALGAIGRYSNSADNELGYQHFVNLEGRDLLSDLPEREKVRLLGYAKRAWKDIQSRDGQIRTNNDHLRKMWALSKPDLSTTGAGNRRAATVLFLDEAQDTPPVLAKVVADQKMQKVIVGDGDQQIYSFTGAKNYLDDVQVDDGNDLPLSTSYRFGATIGDIANRFLQVLGSKERVVGGGSTDGALVTDMGNADAILTRSNGGMIGAILSEQMNDRTVGVAKGTKKDLQLFIDSARYLKGEGPAPSAMHEDLAPFEKWADVENAIAEDGDPKLTMLDNLISKYGLDGLEQILDRVVEVEGTDDGGNTLAATGLLAKVNVVNVGDGLTLTGGTYPLNEALKTDTGAGLAQFGFKWDGAAKVWGFHGTPAQQKDALDRLRTQFGVPAGNAERPDVMVVTAHKSKGLEWDRVKIGDDFPQPKTDEDGHTTFPDDENLRLAYVAVTRAGKELDPGSLNWVFAHSDPNGDTIAAAPDATAEADVPEERVAVAPEDLPRVDETTGTRSHAFRVADDRRDPEPHESVRAWDGWFVLLPNPQTGETIRGEVLSQKHDGNDSDHTYRVLDRESGNRWTVTVPAGTPIVTYPKSIASGNALSPEALALRPDARLDDGITDMEHALRAMEYDPKSGPYAEKAQAALDAYRTERDRRDQENASAVDLPDMGASTDANDPRFDASPDEDLSDQPGDNAETRDRKRRKRDSRKRYDPSPGGGGNGGGGGPGAGPLAANPPLGQLPLDGDADPTGGGGSGDSGETLTPDGRRLGDLTYEELAEEMNRTLLEQRDALNAGDDEASDRLGDYADRVHAVWLARNASRPTGPNGGQVTIASALRPGDSIYLEGDLYDVETNTETTGKSRRLTLVPSLGGGVPVARLEVWPAGREVELEVEQGTNASTGAAAAASATDGFDPNFPETDASRNWIRENWNDGNPLNKAPLGRIPVSGVLASDLAMYVNVGEADGVDQGYTMGAGNRFVVVHDKPATISTLEAIEDIKNDQAGDSPAAAATAKAAGARIKLVRDIPDPERTPATSPAAATTDTDEPGPDDGATTQAPSSSREESIPAPSVADGTIENAKPPTGRVELERREVPLTDLITTDVAMREVLDSGRVSDTPDKPILLYPRDDMPGKFEIGDGHHRVAQAIRERRTTVPALIERHQDEEQYEGPFYDFAASDRPSADDPTLQPTGETMATPVVDVAASTLGDGAQAVPDPASASADADVRPETLVNGHLPNPQGLTLPADVSGGYSPEQIEFLSHYAPGQVVANIGDKWHVGDFEGVTKGNDYVFRPGSSLDEHDVLSVKPEDLHEVRGIRMAEGLAESVDPHQLRPGTRVAFTRNGKQRVGLLEQVTPDGRAEVRDANGDLHQTTIGGTVRPVLGGYLPGSEPAEATFAPKRGVWMPNGEGQVAGVPGEWVAGIAPEGNGYRWEVSGVPGSGFGAASGNADTEAAARQAVSDALTAAGATGAGITTLPGDDENDRDSRSRGLRDTLAESTDAAEGDTATDVADETAGAPDIDGATAGWVPTGELQPGDIARVDGDNGNGSATTRTGHVLGTPETVEVHSPTGGKPARGTRTTVGGDRTGLGDRETLLSPEDSVAARVERPDEYGDADNPAGADESQVLAGKVRDILPADANGIGVFPGSVVTDGRGRQGVVTEVWDLDATVRWSGSDKDERIRPGLLHVDAEQQSRASGWTKAGRKVTADQMVALDGADPAKVISVSGDEVQVETADGEHRTVPAGDVKVIGTVRDNPPPTDSYAAPTFDAPPSIEGLDVRPTAPVKPEPLDQDTSKVVANLNDGDREVLGELGLDTDATSPMQVQQAAARLRHGMPISVEQATDLSAWLGALLGSKGVPAGRARKAKRLRNRIDAANTRAGGGTPEPRWTGDTPVAIAVADVERGDVIAVPNPATGEAAAGTVRGRWRTQNGQVVVVTVEHADGSWSTHRLTPDGQVFLLPDLDALDKAPEYDEPTNVIEEDRPFTEPRVSDRLQEAAQAVIDAALGDSDVEAPDLAELAATVTEGNDATDQHNASRRLETSLAGAGISPESAEAAHDAAEHAADRVAEQVADMIAATVTDAEPLPGESNADAADRVRDRLREAADEVSYDAAAAAAINRASAIEDGASAASPSPKERAHAEREVADALRADLFAMADQLAAAGDVENANALSDVAARLAGRPDEVHVQRAIAAASMGRGPSRVRSLAARIRGMFARARARFLDRVAALMGAGARAKRSLKAALVAARTEWNGTPEIARLVADAASHLADGGDPETLDVATVEPAGFAERMAYWAEQLPAEPGMFGRREATRRGFRGLTLDRLRGGAPLEPEDLTGSVLDRAPDGGPGEYALSHHDALTGVGRAVRDEVNARIRALLPEFGNEPASVVREARDYAERASSDERGDLTDDELAKLRRKARGEALLTAKLYADARAEALLGVLSQVRPMGPQGAATLNVQGRSGKAPEVDAVRWAEQHFPTDWLTAGGTVEVLAGRMGSYAEDGTITVAPLREGLVDGSGRYGASALHGLAHHFETTVPGLAEAAWVHHWKATSAADRSRRGRFALGWLTDLFPGVGFEPGDGAARGATWHGTEAAEGHYEWAPTGFEMIFAGSDENLDDDLEEFMLGLLAWLGRNR